MKRLLMAILAAAFVLGGNAVAAKADEQSYLKAALQSLAEIHARSLEIQKAREYVGRCRADVDRCRPRVERVPAAAPAPAPLPVAIAPPVAAPIPAPKPLPPASAPLVMKTQVAVAPVPVKEKPKAVEQAKTQGPAKPQQSQPAATSSPLPAQTTKPAEEVQIGVKVYAMKVPLLKDTTIRGVFYKKDEPLWAIIRENKSGRVIDQNGKPTNDPELAKAPPRNAILVPFKAPQL